MIFYSDGAYAIHGDTIPKLFEMQMLLTAFKQEFLEGEIGLSKEESSKVIEIYNSIDVDMNKDGYTEEDKMELSEKLSDVFDVLGEKIDIDKELDLLNEYASKHPCRTKE